MTISKKKMTKKLQKAFEDSVYELGQQTLERAKDLVPVGNGELKDSGKITQEKGQGWTITFEASYASDVEEGVSRGQHPANYRMDVSKHKRRLASGKITTVRKHTKQYKNYQRPWNIGGDDWRIVTMADKEGVPFLTDAWTHVRSRVKDKQLKKMLPTHLTRRPIDSENKLMGFLQNVSPL